MHSAKGEGTNAAEDFSTTTPSSYLTLTGVTIRRLGCVDYDAATLLQEQLVAARRAGQIPDTLLLCEHPPVITLGRGFHPENLLLTPEQLGARGIQVRQAARGGDVTYHGPGQLVGYPIVDLAPPDGAVPTDPRRQDRTSSGTRPHRDVHAHLRGVEEVLIQLLAGYDLTGVRVPGRTGVWVGEAKVAAIGVAVRRWVTWHGFALNVGADLSAFDCIVPCGIRDRGVTSLSRLLGRPVTLVEVQDRLAELLRAPTGLA